MHVLIPIYISHLDITSLHGRTNYGDSIEDEWVIVYILRELSKRHPDIWIKVADSDGEFLLIEAAGTLPSWLEPEVADNRVSFTLLRPLGILLTVYFHKGLDPSRRPQNHQAQTEDNSKGHGETVFL